MKAQYVYENIEFERGLELKDAMKIGIEYQKWELHKKLGEDLYKNIPGIIRSDVSSELARISSYNGEKFTNDYYVTKPPEKFHQSYRSDLRKFFKDYPFFDFISFKQGQTGPYTKGHYLRFKWNPNKA